MSLLIKKTYTKVKSELTNCKILKGNGGTWNEGYDEVVYTNIPTFMP